MKTAENGFVIKLNNGCIIRVEQMSGGKWWWTVIDKNGDGLPKGNKTDDTLKQAFQFAIEVYSEHIQRQALNDWVNIKTELPLDGHWILIRYHDQVTQSISIAYYREIEKAWYWTSNNTVISDQIITHWKSLPDLPEII